MRTGFRGPFNQAADGDRSMRGYPLVDAVTMKKNNSGTERARLTLKQKVVIILGPTGIGKTRLVLDLAQRVNGEIVSADSVQVYRYMDIGSAKPTAEERALVLHHLIDIVDPDEEFSAGRYRQEAQRAIESISGRKKPVLVSGGTGLYIKALIRGLSSQPQADEEFRRDLRLREAKEGKGYLYQQLIKSDPASAARIHPNDIFRTIRALEVYHLTGMPLSQLHGEHNFGESPYDCLQIGLYLQRDQLYRHINERCELMMAAGFLDEVRALRDRGYGPALKSMQSLGYRHLCAYLEGRIPLDEAVRTMKRDTRRFAKRQKTWFRRDQSIVWVDNGLEPVDEVEELVREFLGPVT